MGASDSHACMMYCKLHGGGSSSRAAGLANGRASTGYWQSNTALCGSTRSKGKHGLRVARAVLPACRCRNSISSLVRSMNGIWPEGTAEAPAALRQWLICGPAEFRGWVTCQGSSPDTRGYSCGLWELFHTVSFRCAAVACQLLHAMAMASHARCGFACCGAPGSTPISNELQLMLPKKRAGWAEAQAQAPPPTPCLLDDSMAWSPCALLAAGGGVRPQAAGGDGISVNDDGAAVLQPALLPLRAVPEALCQDADRARGARRQRQGRAAHVAVEHAQRGGAAWD